MITRHGDGLMTHTHQAPSDQYYSFLNKIVCPCVIDQVGRDRCMLRSRSSEEARSSKEISKRNGPKFLICQVLAKTISPSNFVAVRELSIVDSMR